MADSALPTSFAIADRTEPLRPSLLVRLTHWINAGSFAALVVSGVAILLAHPRLYWGETGNINTPSLIDLPLPFMLTGQSGWGRSLHFLSAWITVTAGALYLISGILSRHFADDVLPGRTTGYSRAQRATYSIVVFALFPLVVWTGLAMSPAVVAIFAPMVTLLGGQQSARTIHFFVACALVLFLLIHVGMVVRAGFRKRVTAMVTGHE